MGRDARRRACGTLHLLGEQRRDLRDYEQAELQLRAADSIYRELGDDTGVANNSHSLADLALDRGDYADTIEIYRSTLTEYAGVDSRIDAYCLAGIASALAATGHDAKAAALWGAVRNAEKPSASGCSPASAGVTRRTSRASKPATTGRRGRTLTLEQAAEILDSPS